jgi:hypothetical protein
MKVARTDALQQMTGTMIARLAHGFYHTPFNGEHKEVFDAIDVTLAGNLR